MTPETRRFLTKTYLAHLARSSKPIILGPYRSELGFEALYLIPFLRWFVKTYKIDPKRLHCVTRGGAAVLYGLPSVDLYRLRSVDTVRLENQYDWQGTKLQKQTAMTPWDRDVMREAAARLLGRGEKYHVLHPSWMYWALAPFWDEQRGMAYLASMTDYEPITGIPPLLQPLPAQYVAMKWYDRVTWPGQDPQVQQCMANLVSIVGASTKVVLLTSAPDCDDHVDILIKHPSVMTLPAVPPEQNLLQQIQVLSKASAFLGPYGGMAQLALRMGIPSASFYKAFGGTANAHLSLSLILSKRTKVPFLVGSIEDAQSWQRLVSVPVATPQLQSVSV